MKIGQTLANFPDIARGSEPLAKKFFEYYALATGTDSTAARLLMAKALARLARHQEAVDELRLAVRADPITPEVHRELGFAAVRVGDFANARTSWEHFLRLAPGSPDVGRVRAGLEGLTRLQHVLEAHADG